MYLCRRFIEEKSSFEYGQVNHALAAAMRTLVKEYLILVTQLEQLHRQGLLSLQKLWFYIQPAMRTIDILASLGADLLVEGLQVEGSLRHGRAILSVAGHSYYSLVAWWQGRVLVTSCFLKQGLMYSRLVGKRSYVVCTGL